MEDQVKHYQDDTMKDEDFPDEFQCCVCLDLLYKPVVLGCGHMACFWCIYKAMDFFRDSHCPVCRHLYNHFPRSCRLLHFLLQKLYPSAYRRRGKQVSQEEERSGNVSRQFDNKNDLVIIEEVSATVVPKSDSAGGSSTDQSRTIVPEDRKSSPNTALNSGTSIGASVLQESQTKYGVSKGVYNQVVVSDLACPICKQLLCRPVVLNCGDVYCEACIINPSDEVCKCPVCDSPHPNGFPNICLVLEHFLEEQFSEEYAARKESLLEQLNGNVRPLISSKQNQKQAAEGSSGRSWLSNRGPKVHARFGCDYCGMCPIIGERYKCKDCKEKIGFDLCEGCYKSSCKRPGRFNQQHTEDHQFVIVEPSYLNHIILRVGTISSVEHGLDNQNLLLVPEGVNPEELGIIDDMQEVEEESLSSNPANGGPEDVGGTAETPRLIDTSEDEGQGGENLF